MSIRGMKRRAFITLIGGAATSVGERAAIGEIPRIGVLWHAANEQEAVLGRRCCYAAKEQSKPQ
jgi:hypothetical protein